MNKIVVISEDDLRKIINQEVTSAFKKAQLIKNDFRNDKLTRTQVCKLAGISMPTLQKLVREGFFTEYGISRNKTWFLRNEVEDTLRSMKPND